VNEAGLPDSRAFLALLDRVVSRPPGGNEGNDAPVEPAGESRLIVP